MSSRDDKTWYKANRISRADLHQKYPEASHFRKTDGNVAVIDFGTTFCSLALSTAENADIYTPLHLNSGYPRVPTAILLKESGKVTGHRDLLGPAVDPPTTCDYEIAAFGYDAVNRVVRRHSKFLYFEQFKMALQHDENVNRNIRAKSSDGREFYLVEVIAFVLKHLKHCLEEHLSRKQPSLKITDFDWVITVPAIWRARGKQMMREAAYKAKLLSTDQGISCFLEVGKGVPRSQVDNPDKLTLALEPEAAAIYCQEEDARQARLSGRQYVQSEHYVVIDIGGGTVDITAHHHDQEQGITIVTSPIGNNCGGTMVNREFANFVQGIVEPNEVSNSEENPDGSGEWMAILNNLRTCKEFEEQKLSFGDNTSGNTELLSGEPLAVRLPQKFVNFYGTDKIKSGIAALNDDRIEFGDDVIYITPSKFAEFFEPAIKGILECTKEAFAQLEETVDTVFLVGGFGGCKYTYGKISTMLKDKFPQRDIRVYVPKNHNLAVTLGAVKYRLKPDIIHSRKMDASYGTEIAPVYNCKHHRPKPIVVDSTGTIRSKNVYCQYVEKGEQISSDEIVTGELHPAVNSATEMKIPIYSSFERNIRYTSTPDDNPDPLVRKIGELHVDIPNPDNLPQKERKVELTMDFSHTEIQVRARYVVTGEEVKVVADFLSSHVSIEQR